MSLELSSVKVGKAEEKRIREVFLAWDGLAGRLATAKLEDIRKAIAIELGESSPRSSILKKLVAKYNALQSRDNELDLARAMMNKQ